MNLILLSNVDNVPKVSPVTLFLTFNVISKNDTTFIFSFSLASSLMLFEASSGTCSSFWLSIVTITIALISVTSSLEFLSIFFVINLFVIALVLIKPVNIT